MAQAKPTEDGLHSLVEQASVTPMPRTAHLTIELPEEAFARFEAQSEREGLRPEAKVIELITRSLLPAGDQSARALARLRQLRAGMPPIDAVEIVRAVRNELEDRAAR